MISITCTNCQAQLSIDDAFAGGVCRCQYCGAIQTVPSKNAKPARASTPQANAVTAVSGAGQKTLYTKKGQTPGSGTGLNDLAEVIASSGLSGSGLVAGHNRRKPPTSAATPNSKLVPILIGAGAVIVVLLVVVIWMATRGRSTDKGQPGSSAQGSTSNGTPAVAAPSFLGLRLDEQVVVYLLDRGQASRSTLDYTKLAFLKSLGSLRPDQKFQVIFWKTRAPLTVFPPAGPAEVSGDQIDACRKAIDEVSAYDSSDIKPAMERAMKGNPNAIVIVTPKPLDDGFVKNVLDVRKNSPVKIHCVSLDDPSLGGVMHQVASKTGGTYRNVDKAELVNAAR